MTAPARSGRRAALALGLLGLAALALPGCRAVLRLPEPRGVHRSDPVDPAREPGWPPWIRDPAAGLVSVAPGLDLRRHARLVVHPFEVNPEDVHDAEDRGLAQDVVDRLHRRLLEGLRGAGAFADVLDARGAAPAGDALSLRGTVTRLSAGDRALRHFVGFGAGRTTLQVETRLITSEGGVVVATADRRIASKGFLGGDGREFLLRSADEIADGIVDFLRRRAGAAR